MNATRILRWGGLSALLGGLLGIAGELAFFVLVGGRPYRDAAPTTGWLVILTLAMLATVLTLLGLAALYGRQSRNTGRLGLLAFAMATLGTMMLFGHQWSAAYVIPVLAEGVPDYMTGLLADTTTVLAGGVLLTALLMAVGWILFGIASLRARVLPAAAGWIVLVGAILFFFLDLVNFALDGLVLYVGLAWMGWWLWSERPQPG